MILYFLAGTLPYLTAPLNLCFRIGQSILGTDRCRELATGLDDKSADIMLVVVSFWTPSRHLIVEPPKWFECSWLDGGGLLLSMSSRSRTMPFSGGGCRIIAVALEMYSWSRNRQ